MTTTLNDASLTGMLYQLRLLLVSMALLDLADTTVNGDTLWTSAMAVAYVSRFTTLNLLRLLRH